jgi:hypothetical protein
MRLTMRGGRRRASGRGQLVMAAAGAPRHGRAAGSTPVIRAQSLLARQIIRDATHVAARSVGLRPRPDLSGTSVQMQPRALTGPGVPTEQGRHASFPNFPVVSS